MNWIKHDKSLNFYEDYNYLEKLGDWVTLIKIVVDEPYFVATRCMVIVEI